MVLATFLALAAAVLHAGWNLAIKRWSPAVDGTHGTSSPRWLALWGQFLCAGIISGVLFVAVAGLSGVRFDLNGAWGWALLTGLVHVPYTVFLARAYDGGDFSVTYPIARGGGAVLASIGGVALLSDSLSGVSGVGIAIAFAGMIVLAGRGAVHSTRPAATVAVCIGTYTLIDSHGARLADTPAYALAVFVTIALGCSAWGVATGQAGALGAAARAHWPRMVGAGVASGVTYGLVVTAVRFAPVGYVASLRESSVVLAAFAGWKWLAEGDHRRRIAAASTVAMGLIVLILGS